jgi:ABC-type Fe3+ transport system permease subunit
MNGYRRNRACSCARCQCSGYLIPTLLVTVGVLFLLGQFSDRFPGLTIDNTWPVFLIVIGVVLLFQRKAPLTGHVDVSQIGPGAPPPGGPNPGGGAQPPPGRQQVTHG